MKKQKIFYSGMAKYNDFKAIKKGRIWQRIWNRFVMRIAGKLFK